MSQAGVAPRAGAWIETKETSFLMPAVFVAPRAGAWIETALFDVRQNGF